VPFGVDFIYLVILYILFLPPPVYTVSNCAEQKDERERERERVREVLLTIKRERE
jgi:hypothetical protein